MTNNIANEYFGYISFIVSVICHGFPFQTSRESSCPMFNFHAQFVKFVFSNTLGTNLSSLLHLASGCSAIFLWDKFVSRDG